MWKRLSPSHNGMGQRWPNFAGGGLQTRLSLAPFQPLQLCVYQLWLAAKAPPPAPNPYFKSLWRQRVFCIAVLTLLLQTPGLLQQPTQNVKRFLKTCEPTVRFQDHEQRKKGSNRLRPPPPKKSEGCFQHQQWRGGAHSSLTCSAIWSNKITELGGVQASLSNWPHSLQRPVLHLENPSNSAIGEPCCNSYSGKQISES